VIDASTLRRVTRAHIETCRPDTLLYVGLVSLGAAIYTRPHAGIGRLILAWIVPTLGWVASLYGGDFFDRDLDAQSKPYRPIPSKRMTPRAAIIGMVAAILAGLVLSIALNPRLIILVAAATCLGVAYSALLKKRGLPGNLVRGGPTALVVLFGSMSVQHWPEPSLALAALVYWIHDAQSNLLGALCDRDSDRSGGYMTFPAERGDRATLWALGIMLIAWAAPLTVIPAVSHRLSHLPGFYACAATATLLNCFALRLVQRAERPIPRSDAVRAHEWLVIERLFLGAALLTAIDGISLAICVLLPALAATLGFRRWMRSIYQPRSQSVHPSTNAVH